MSISNFISKGLRYSFTVAFVTYIFTLIVNINHFSIARLTSNLFLITLAVFAAFIVARAVIAVRSIIF